MLKNMLYYVHKIKEKSWGEMSEESVKWFLYGVLAVLAVEFLFYMIVLIV